MNKDPLLMTFHPRLVEYHKYKMPHLVHRYTRVLYPSLLCTWIFCYMLKFGGRGGTLGEKDFFFEKRCHSLMAETQKIGQRMGEKQNGLFPYCFPVIKKER